MKGIRYCWSHDGEEYMGDEANREDALAEATAEATDQHEPGDTVTVHTAEVRHAMHFLREWEHGIGGSCIEDMEQSLFDCIASDESIIEMDKESKTELGKLILDFVEKRASFNRWGVANPQEHEITISAEEAK